ncbi:alpha/beta hydrolase [Amycolatopsis sp.]|uniref:alpha/beta fold hydrolase n=1 Tax=Amycolatopsis sp. TaxID=37632 RepID=UPI002CCEDB32|nr:alpha/beta hydrolase [Amycolatopsis sp.]HVV08050.1 alpha/beta hydrolase [Amycolatopsis sp.]
MSAQENEYRSIWTWLRELDFRQGRCDAGGVRTRFAEAGDPAAPGVLLLHGTGGHWETFAPNLAALSEHFHVVAVDMVGNGFSEKPDYDYEIAVYVRQAAAVLDHFGMDRASVIGMSLGAWVTARLALDHPDRVEKIILMSPAGLVATASNMARIRAERTQAVQNPDWDSIKAMFDHLIADERNRIPDVIALRQAIYRLPDTRETIDHLLILQDPDARERNLLTEQQWSSIKAPALVVASGKDYSEYENTARRVAALLPNSQLLEMPDVKHWPHFEDPETFNPAALKFLRG